LKKLAIRDWLLAFRENRIANSEQPIKGELD